MGNPAFSRSNRGAAAGWSGGQQVSQGEVSVKVDGKAYEGFSLVQSQFPAVCFASKLRFPRGVSIAFGAFPGEAKRVAVVYPQSLAPILIARAYIRQNQAIAADCLTALRSLPANDIPPDLIEKVAPPAAAEKSKKVSTFKADKFQSTIIDMFLSAVFHIVVLAGAGSGKSTVAREMVRRAFLARKERKDSKEFRCLFIMFNAGNRQDTNKSLRSELPSVKGCSFQVHSFHSYGLGRVVSAYPGKDSVKVLDPKKSDAKLDILFRENEQSLLREIGLSEMNALAHFVPAKQLVHRVKNAALAYDQRAEIAKCLNYPSPLDLGKADAQAVVSLAVRLLQLSLPDSGRFQTLDGDDMIYWLAMGYGDIEVDSWSEVFVDESQDLNPCQHRIVEAFARAGARIVLIGDPAQAIYLWRGAASQSMDDVKNYLAETSRGVESFPMPINRRCSRAVVQRANEVPGWSGLLACDTAPAGEVRHIVRSEMFQTLKPGDAIISRVNAPLVSAAIACLEAGLPCRVVGGGEAAKEIVGVLEQACAGRTLPIHGEGGVISRLDKWYEKQLERLGSTPGMSMALDKLRNHCEALKIVASRETLNIRGRLFRLNTGSDLTAAINALVVDDNGPKEAAVNIMTGHKSKGSEFPRVFNITPRLFPHPNCESEEAIQQDFNLYGVVITRAQLHYYEVDDFVEPQDESEVEQ